MSNRINEMIARKQAKIDNLTPEQVAKVEEDATFDFEMATMLAKCNAEMAASGILTADEAQTIYMMVGEGGEGKVNKQSLAARLTLMQVLSEVLAAKTKGRRR